MDIVWRDIPFSTAENLTRLSHFMGAYATVTMEKATEVSTLLKEKQERIAQLEQQLETEKASVNKQAAEELTQLQQRMDVLRISHEADISAKNTQLQAWQQAMEIYKDVPTIKDFIKEALELNSLIVK